MKIECTEENDQYQCVYYTKGHVNAYKFLDFINEKYGIGLHVTEEVKNVKLSHARKVPMRGSVDYNLMLDADPGRGAFKVTYIWIDTD
jgi:hypothetical protein